MANSPARAVVDVGSVIADTYRIEALIGRGGMGAVFLASHARLPGKKVAIKLLHAEVEDAEVLARFRREAEIASRLGHPNIVAVHDFNLTAEGMPYLVLEYLQGETLAQRIKDGGPLSIEHTMSIIRQVGSALAAAHREGIVHRDLKPHNIFLVPTEVDGRIIEIAKVLDFGISKIRGSQTVKTQETALLGTPQYMAPEQATGKHTSVDERTDVFALGAIVHEMLTGQPAFTGASIPEVVFKVVYEQPLPLPDTIPPSIINTVKQAMEKEPTSRFANVNAFVEALTGSPLTLLRPPLPPSPEVGFAAGSKHVPDALASTMASGDHSVPTPGIAATAVQGDAATLHSLSVPTGPAKPHREIDLAHTQATPTQPTPLATPARKVWPLALVGGLAVAAIAVVMLVMLRGDDDKPDHRRSAVAEKRPAITLREAKPDVVAVEPRRDPAPDPAPPESTENKPTKKKAEKRARVETTDAPADEGTAALKNVLDEAEAAWARGDRMDAMRLTSRVVNEGGSSRVAAEAHVLRGTILCNDITQANGELRQLRGYPQLAKKLRAKCPALQ